MKDMIIAGNWKMNTNAFESVKLAESIKSYTEGKQFNSKILICPPFTSLQAVQQVVEGSNVLLGAQNCHYEEKGAFTGEISLPMILYLGCTYVILGHSERRTYFHEDDEIINRKTLAALEYGINPVVCIGETLAERQSNKTFEVLERQITLGLKGIAEENINEMVVAYEPVWAIGTGVNATPEQVEEAHGFIKETIARTLSMKTGSLPVLYGGSVNAGNAESILELDNVNGALIGGASLKSESFISIIKTSEEILGRA